MYRSKYLSKTKENNLIKVVELHKAVSLDEGLDTLTETDENDEKYEYLERVFGQELGNILTECAKVKPEDPILFVASLLESASLDNQANIHLPVRRRRGRNTDVNGKITRFIEKLSSPAVLQTKQPPREIKIFNWSYNINRDWFWARKSEKREVITEAWRSEKREAVTEARRSGKREAVMKRNDRVKTIQTN